MMMIDLKINTKLFILLLLSTFLISFDDIKKKSPVNESTVKITFINTINNSRIVLNDSMYTDVEGLLADVRGRKSSPRE